MARFKVKLANPALLAWARESAGYSVPQFAEALGKTPDRIVAWENGADAPTYRQLEQLANKVKRPLAAFFLPVVPQEPPRPTDLRTVPDKGPDEYQPTSLVAFREARSWLGEAEDLLHVTGSSIEFSIPSRSVDEDPENVASALRELLGVDVDEQIGWPDDHYWVCDAWRDVLFEWGVLVMVFRMPLRDVRAFSMMADRLAGIGLNTADRGYGRVFSMFHELTHLCLRQPGVSGERSVRHAATPKARLERYCERAAASFLLPADHPKVRGALTHVASDQSMGLVRDLATMLKVSKYAVLGRAWDLDYISADTYWSVVRDWRRRDAQTRKPLPGGDHVVNRVSHIGKRLTSLVFDALDGKHISSYYASKLLGIDPKHFRKARMRAVWGVR